VRTGRVLMLSPHFPPDTSAASHRVRLLAPHLPHYGWEPTVVSVDPRDYEGRLDPRLHEMVPKTLRVDRCRAWSSSWTRPFGVGDLGIRSLAGMYRTSRRLLKTERFDALFITIFPSYTALLGPVLARSSRLPFVLDYQDPWVGAWGLTVGAGSDGRPDLKSRLSRGLAAALEPGVVRAADAVTAVSQGTYEQVRDRYPEIASRPWAEIPVGGEPADFEFLKTTRAPNRFFDPHDQRVHICYVGTLLPTGLETLRGLLLAVAALKQSDPQLYGRLSLHFFGTSNQTSAKAIARVLPVAHDIGVAECVTEVPARIDYLDALTVLTQASAILLLGSSERHYTASKLYPALLARRPILAIFHSASSVVDILRRAARSPAVRMILYDDETRADAKAAEVSNMLREIVQVPCYDPNAVDWSIVSDYSAKTLAGRLAGALDRVRRG
jgi:hypothetical protein